MATQLEQELNGINGRMNRWRMLEQALWWGAGLLLAVAVAALSDLLFRPGRQGRMVLFGLIAGSALCAVVVLMAIVHRKRSAAAVAAILEHRFPQLDNHLINRVLFSSESHATGWQRQYLREPIPGWSQLPLEALKNRRARQWGAGLLIGALLVLAAPGLWMGQAWGVSLMRVLNPFADLNPPTLATLIGVEPGDAVVLQGEDLLLTCLASGRSGQAVDLYLWPQDDRASIIRVGELRGEGTESFTHRIAKLSGPLQYRFRVGDAPPSERYSITALEPLAFTALDVRISPPAYTGFLPAEVDGLTESIAIPRYSRVELRLAANRDARRAQAALEPEAPLDLTPSDAATRWSGLLNVASGSVIRVELEDQRGDVIAMPLRFTLIDDLPPSLHVIQPATARAPLAPGAMPLIAFEADDDYALAWVRLERIALDADARDAGTPIRTWTAQDRQRSLSGEWHGRLDDLEPDSAFRLVALDYRGDRPGRETQSAPIRFEAAKRTERLDAERQRTQDARASLAQLVEWQRANIETSLILQGALPSFDRSAWSSVRDLQSAIRQTAAALMQMSDALPAAVRPVLNRALQGPMTEVLGVLDRLDASQAPQREDLAARALALERNILRMLTHSESGMDRNDKNQSASGILALIEALIKAQVEIIDATRSAERSGQSLRAVFVDRQDILSVEVGELTTLCRNEAEHQAAGDADYAALLQRMAALSEERRIQGTMLIAAERMEQGSLDEAQTAQDEALQGLLALHALLSAWSSDEAQSEREKALETVQTAKDRLQKLTEIQSEIVEALRATRSQGDKSEGILDDLIQEMQEIKPRMGDALLEIATDLHMMPDLPVGNELVEDLFQVFEEVEQAPGTESMTEGFEQGIQKEDWILDALEQATDRLDDLEMWLSDAPDTVARNAEAIDQQEMPDIPVIPLPEALRDIIGDLLEQQEELREQAQDSASNLGMADLEAGWEVQEGDLTSYAAKGVSGNTPPEHKEQDGRANIGREGMSDGETVAASGAIEAGDDDIEKRMTRDPSQGGTIESEEHTDAVATGGGKLSGFSDEMGMPGMGPRRDAASDEGSELGRQANLRRQAESLYAQATLNHVRTGNLDEAIRHMRQAESALAEGRPIGQVHEFQRRAVGALRATRSQLDAGVDDRAVGVDAQRPIVDEAIASTPDEAPAEYRDMVSEYFKALSEVTRAP